MPEMDGIETFNMLRQNSLKNAETPVVMLTGNAEESYAKMYKDCGIDAYLVKPVLKDHLIDVLCRFAVKKD